MKGFQIGISKNGQALEGTELVYRVYDKSSMTLLDEEVYDLGACLDGQYPYLPFGNELCTGKIYITFTYRANGNTEPAPGIFMNHSEIPHVATYVDGEKIEGNLKCYYIYSHNTYPFLYDSRVMLCVFLAATACVAFPAYSKKKEVAESDEEK